METVHEWPYKHQVPKLHFTWVNYRERPIPKPETFIVGHSKEFLFLDTIMMMTKRTCIGEMT